MDLQDAKQRRLRVWGSVFLLLTAGAGAYHASRAEEPPLVLQQKPVQEEAEVPTGIIGLQQADEGKALRNPFSLLHEREGEIPVQAVKGAEVKQASSHPDIQKIAIKKKEAKKIPAQPKKRADFVLRGIGEGAGGRLALLQTADDTAAVAVGEHVSGWQVTAVGSNTVTLVRDGQVLELPLTMSDMGAN
ncbi:hypothetical protein SAMN05216582_1163 [Selenomonas ruminantium]|uniref:Uncharacterized protein n=1 Tax=Selenomonas ruminantium TaxID=971 RepID=A0A1M6V1X5_SELRU|nr:hypothetical protein [Selenomonas ruminantium]SHK75296.1 hypothetical protein SAMN05216582_1163 [Selenomonas ruminantium]